MRYGKLREATTPRQKSSTNTRAVMLWSFTLLALCATAYGRAVNISNTWVLPEEGFPVFYRYFRDRISWYEADAVCQFHHANLVTVDTTAQYDAVRAYLRELDISSAVWVGLIRSNPDGDFTWTDYRGLSGEGYWSSAPDNRDAPLCAAADPAADYRWEAKACGGPSIASFICELPVPQWALGAEGCMVRALPALTALYLPESASIQLAADCGLAGVKKVQCNGNVKREDLLKELSCFEYSDDEINTNFTTPWPSQTTSNDLENSMDPITTEGSTTTERNHIETVKAETTIIPTDLMTIKVNSMQYIQNQEKVNAHNKFKPIIKSKEINYKNIGDVHNNNLQSNDIPKLLNEDDLLLKGKVSKFPDIQKIQHKILHEELARRGNFDTIFTQPTDHFVPPLVMAKARLSDDMTVMSLEEKHAHLAEEQRLYQRKLVKIDATTPVTSLPSVATSTEEITTTEITTDNILTTKNTPLSLTTLILPIFENSDKKVLNHKSTKYGSPKKYTPKTYDFKIKPEKTLDLQHKRVTDKTEEVTKPITTLKDIESTTDLVTEIVKTDSTVDDEGIELKVIINDISQNILEQTASVATAITSTVILNSNSKYSTKSPSTINTTTYKIIDTTIANVPDNTATASPIMIKYTPNTSVLDESIPESAATTTNPALYSPVKNVVISIITDSPIIETNTNFNIATEEVNITDASNLSQITQNEITTNPPILRNVEEVLKTNGSTHIELSSTSTETSALSTTDKSLLSTTVKENITTIHVNEISTNMMDIITDSVNTEYTFVENSTDQSFIDDGYTSEIDDFQSPLLSGASDPLPKPNRSRRPQTPPNRNKFNPFRILG